MLTREQILAADDIRTERVDVPEWGDFVFVRVVSAAQRDAFEASLQDDPKANIRARVAALALCDESGELMFTAAEAEALGRKSYPALDRVFRAAIRLNAIREQDVEELEKNSGAGTSGGSSSGSPAT